MIRRLIALGCLVALPRVLSAQGDTAAVGVRPEFLAAPFMLRTPPALRATWLGAPRLTPGQLVSAWDSSVTASVDSARREQDTALRLATIYGTSPTLNAAGEEIPARRRGVFGLT